MTYSQKFQDAIRFTLQWEGTTLEHDPNDPGGTTFAGIDQEAHPDVDVARLTLDGAKQIYWRTQWQWCQGDSLEAPMATIIFDATVNPGRSSLQWLQSALGAKPDGVIGPVTIAQINTANSHEMTVFLDRCESYYRSVAIDHPALRRYLPGWQNRNNARRALLREV